jgi:hypothetical protein
MTTPIIPMTMVRVEMMYHLLRTPRKSMFVFLNNRIVSFSPFSVRQGIARLSDFLSQNSG